MSLVKYKKSWERNNSAFQVAIHCTCVTFITAGAERTGGQYFECTLPTIGTFDKCFVEYTSRGKSMASVLLAFYSASYQSVCQIRQSWERGLGIRSRGPSGMKFYLNRASSTHSDVSAVPNPASRSSILSRISASYSIHEFCFRRTIVL